MSTPEQVLDNTKTANSAEPLTDEEKKALAEAMRLYRESAPIKQSEIERYKGLLYHGVPVSAILQAWSICQIQPSPSWSKRPWPGSRRTAFDRQKRNTLYPVMSY